MNISKPNTTSGPAKAKVKCGGVPMRSMYHLFNANVLWKIHHINNNKAAMLAAFFVLAFISATSLDKGTLNVINGNGKGGKLSDLETP